MAKLTIEDGRGPVYCRAFWTGMDEVDALGDVPTGFGKGSFADIASGNRIRWEVKWYLDPNSKYRGLFTFTSGTGEWKGVSGELDAALEFCTLHEDDLQTEDAPLQVLGFVEGFGSISLP